MLPDYQNPENHRRGSDEMDVAADQAGGNRRPAKASQRRPGGRASEVAAGDTPGAAGEGPAATADSNLHHGQEEEGLAAQDDEAAGDPDEKYLNKKWPSLMVFSFILMWAKARPIIHPPAWVSRAVQDTTGGEHHRFLQARLYVSLWALSFAQEVAIVVVLCLFKQKLVSAGRARAAVRLFTVAALAFSLAVFAVVAGGSGGDCWGDAVAVFLTVAPGMVLVLRKVEELLAKVFGRLFRG